MSVLLTVVLTIVPQGSLLDPGHPGATIVFRSRMKLKHLRRRRRTDQVHPSLLIGYVPDNQVVQRHHWRLVLRQVRQGAVRNQTLLDLIFRLRIWACL